MSGSESFGSGERFYHGVCPVTLRTRDEAAEAGVTCPRCGLVWCVATWILELEKGPSEGLYLRITFVSSSSDYLDIYTPDNNMYPGTRTPRPWRRTVPRTRRCAGW